MDPSQKCILTLEQNDLDLDFYCRAIVHADVERLMRVSCPNVYLGAHHAGARIASNAHVAVDAVFGAHLLLVCSTRLLTRSGAGGGRHAQQH